MAFGQRRRMVNPLLGTFFGIFLAGVVATVMLLLIFEQLGIGERSLRRVMLLGACGLFVTVGIAAYCTTPGEYLLSGRRVPAVVNGMILAIAGFGGTGVAAFTGALFLIGFDALCLALGVLAGLVVMAILVAPFYRKFGAPSVPSFLGRRLDSTAVRLVAAGIAAAPLLLILVAELKMAVAFAAWLAQGAELPAAVLIAVTLMVSLVPGGSRSASWSSAAQSITTLLAILVPTGIIAVMITNLPLGQLSHGPVLRALGRIEATQALNSPTAQALLLDLPGQVLQPIAGRFATPFASVGSLAFVLVTLAVMAGIAGSPGLLARTVTAPSVYEARKSIGWSVFVAGLVIMTMSTVAVFLREALMSDLIGLPPERLPSAVRRMVDLGLAGLDGRARPDSPAAFLFRRDSVMLALPVFMGLPVVLVGLVAAGIVAAAMAAASASATQLGIIVGEDVMHGPGTETGSTAWRLAASRAATAAIIAVAGWIAVALPGDPLDLLLWSLSLSGSALFPVLILAIWWKRLNAWGALAGMMTGFMVAAIGLLAAAVDVGSVPPIMIAALGAPIAMAAAAVGTWLPPGPNRHMLEMVRDLRIPGGEAVHDRELRLAAQRQLRKD